MLVIRPYSNFYIRRLLCLSTMSALPFDKLDIDDVISKLTTDEKVALLTGLDMVCVAYMRRCIETSPA